jgi:hypothetical protein
MASFMHDLWNSIFTPGPTSSLLLATNVSFAALQLVLFALLVATYSIHFVVLSLISGGLWWAINWFVTELKIYEAVAKEKELRENGLARNARGGVESSESDTDAQTVVDEVKGSGSNEVEMLPRGKGLMDRAKGDSQERSKSEISTEDEWEKVSENEKDK